ncbi:sigma-54-dependent transcriptional regulator [Insolitispirillum peregrinum]|uniref:sigma-54-dependent transcriptional regulator n=1 Tax=Insolitispirillum peregrinum TaxID=80876 RepID=UPI00361CB180
MMLNGISVLLIDDEAPFVRSLSYALRQQGMQVTGVHDCQSALDALTTAHPDIALVDLRMPGIDGMGTMERLRAHSPDLPMIMISAHGDTRMAVQAVKAGAADYLTKPFELDELLHCISGTLDRDRLHSEVSYHRQRAISETGLIGDSARMGQLRETVARVAASSTARVLLFGESGTGKALVARALHTQSSRRDQAFVEVNCAALPEQLIEAELFGAERGAYTGAHQKRTGLVTLADGGTLFLDEIGELPLPLQAKLLHFLENGTYRTVGGTKTLQADVRVVAATNRDLAKAVSAGGFREDLFYRLNVIQIPVPPLRERDDDVILLAEHFAAHYAAQEGVSAIRLPDPVKDILRSHPWPGNVRELKNLIERLTILLPGRDVSVDDLPGDVQDALPVSDSPASDGIADQLERAERQLLLDALNQNGGHKARAAEHLGISRHALKRRLQRLGL